MAVYSSWSRLHGAHRVRRLLRSRLADALHCRASHAGRNAGSRFGMTFYMLPTSDTAIEPLRTGSMRLQAAT